MYCRISDINQAGNDSLEGQETAGRAYAHVRNLIVGKVFTDIYTGSKKKRPGYQEMIDHIKVSNGRVKYVIIKCIDRFTRQGTSEYEQMKEELSVLGVELLDIFGIIQPKINALEHLGIEYPWSRYSPSEVSEGVIASQAKIERRTILTRTVGAAVERVRSGFKTKCPVDGFLNKKFQNAEGKKRCIQIPDPERYKYYEKMFELRASGAMTDEEVIKELNAGGFKTKVRNLWNHRTGKIVGHQEGHPLNIFQLRKIIQRPIYCGIICEKWTGYKPIKAQYPGLVSIDTFNKANRGLVYIKQDGDKYEMLYNYHPDKPVVVRNKNNPDFPWKLVLCDYCNKPFYGSASKGKSGEHFPSYHCNREHERNSYRKQDFEEVVLGFFDRICFSPEIMASFELIVREKYKDRYQDIENQVKQVESDLKVLEAEKEQCVAAFIQATSPIIRESIEKKILDTETKIKRTEVNRPKTSTIQSDVDRFIRQVRYTLEHLQKLLTNARDLSIRKALFSLIFNESPKYSQFRFGTPRLSLAFKPFWIPFDLLRSQLSLSVRRAGFEPA